MNTLAKINRAKEETAEIIQDHLYTIMEREFANIDWIIPINVMDYYNLVNDYIRKEHLFKSDYTK